MGIGITKEERNSKVGRSMAHHCKKIPSKVICLSTIFVFIENAYVKLILLYSDHIIVLIKVKMQLNYSYSTTFYKKLSADRPVILLQNFYSVYSLYDSS